MIDEPPHASKERHDLEKRGGEEKGRPMRVGVMGFHLGKRRTAGVTSSRDADDSRTMRPTTADTLVAHEERDVEGKAGVSAAESGPGLAMGDTADSTTASGPAQENKIRSTRSSLIRLPPQAQETPSRMISQTPDNTVNLNLDTDYYPIHDDCDFDNDGTNNNHEADNEILEVPRGREDNRHLRMSTNGLPRTMSGSSSLVSDPVLGTGRISSSSTPPPPPTNISPRSSSILPPIFPSPNIPLSHSPHSQLVPGSRSRPRTAPTTTTSSSTGFMSTAPSSPLASVPPSRPGTGDSSTGSIRHHRLDSIRGAATSIPHGHVQGHHRSTPPPTRDSSPSRSVRFVDYVDGESGHVGPFGPVISGSSGNGNGNQDNEGKKMPVVDIPAATPLPSSLSNSSRSSSFYGNGRTLLGGMEGEGLGPAVSAPATTRPPTR